TRAYTPGGRLTSRADYSGTQTFSQGTYGTPYTISTPLYTLTSILYDAEGSPTSWHQQNVSPSNSYNQTVAYTATGQQGAVAVANGDYHTPINAYFDGVPLQNTEIVD